MALTHWQLDKRQVKVSHKTEAVTISLTGQNLVSYDLAGRFLGSYDHGRNVRRGLDNSFQERWREEGSRGDRLRQRPLPGDEAQALIDGFRERLAKLPADRAAAKAHPDTVQVLERAVSHTFIRLQDSGREFVGIYGHIPILPPDQYRAVVVQATDGCSYNKCAFCTLYRDKIFRVRSPEEFRRHLDRVADFMGPGLSYRNSIFLGDANAITLGTGRLVELLELVRHNPGLGPIVSGGGVHAFLDSYTGTRKSAEDYRLLSSLGLRRVSLGVESGSEELLALVNKPGSREDISSVVAQLKAGGVAVTAIFMIGLGGDRYREEHLAGSISLVRRLPLSAGDMIYLSQFAPTPGAPYVPLAARAGIKPFSLEEMEAETLRWKQSLSGVLKDRGVKVAPYSFQRFIY